LIVRALVFIALSLLGTTPAWAAEPSGCDKFKWPIERERAALTSPDRAKLVSGSELSALPSTGLTLALRAPADAGLPSPPERAPRDGTFAGFAVFKAAPKAGLYTISLSAGAWVDVVQDGRFLKPKATSGATDCDGIRKAHEVRDFGELVRAAGQRHHGEFGIDRDPPVRVTKRHFT
jgi:hypothetical protein